MTTEQWLDYLAQSRDLGMLYPLLTGGEPFLRPDFQEIFAKSIEMGMQPSINSNGTMITEAMAKWLAKHPPVKINITLYGGSEETYQRLCGNGAAFEKVHNAVQWLKEKGVRVKLNTSITEDSVGDLDSMIAYAKSVDVPIQVATYMFPPIRRAESQFGVNDRLTPEKAAYARVKSDWLQGDPRWFAGQALRMSKFVQITDGMLDEQSTRPSKRITCRAGHCSLWFDWQGNMMNCGMYASVKVPMKEKTVHDAWKELREKTHAIRYSPVCTNCPNFQLCHSCIAMVYNETGDTNGRPDYICRMKAAEAKYYQEFTKKLPEITKWAQPESVIENDTCDLEPI